MAMMKMANTRKATVIMMYSDEELILKLKQLIADFENEVVEFKEAKANFNFNDIGKYFSALSNEANIRGIKEGWLIFGVTDQKEIVGTMYRQQGGLKGSIKEIAERTNERLTFWLSTTFYMKICVL